MGPARHWREWMIAGLIILLGALALWLATSSHAGCPPEWNTVTCSEQGRQTWQLLSAGSQIDLTLTPAQFPALVRCLVGDPQRAVLAGVQVDFAPGEIYIVARLRRILAWPLCVRMRWNLQEDPAGSIRWECQEWQIGRLRMPEGFRTLLSRWANRWWESRVSPGWEFSRLELSRGLFQLLGRRR